MAVIKSQIFVTLGNIVGGSVLLALPLKLINAFNEIYPNVTISYEQNNTHLLRNYIDNNQGIDIIMTTDENVRYTTNKEDYVGDYCVDLSAEAIYLGDVSENIISCGKVDGKLVRIPILKNLCGMAVNKTLLEKEGLKVPTNYSEFLDVLEKLKQKGYTPIQGAANHVYSELVMNMAMDMIATDDSLKNAVADGDSLAAEKLMGVFERLQTIIDKGYTDYDINKELPSDNYDGSIMKFFEGDVPFWVCNTESFSGTKKRESKSETFSSNMKTIFTNVCNSYAKGEYATPKKAANAFVKEYAASNK